MGTNQWKTKWDQRYASRDFVFGREPNQFLINQAHQLPQGKILCAGDGEGRNGVWLARQGYDVISIDYSDVGLTKARKLAADYDVNIRFIHAEILEFDLLDLELDGIVNIYLHMTGTEIRTMHEKYRNALNPGGVLLAEVYSKEQLQYCSGGPKSIEALYDIEYFKRDFSDWNRFYLAQEIINLNEGNGHNGAASVVRVVLQKPLD